MPVFEVWQEVRALLRVVLGVSCDHCSDWEIVNLQFPRSRDGKKGVWLIGTFVARVWEEIFVRSGQRLQKKQFFGFLKFKYTIKDGT